MKAVAVVTALNEQETIGNLVTALLLRNDSVIVMDDGSTDDTALVAEFAGAFVHANGDTLGIATSLMTAWGTALEMGATVVTQIDAGGSHVPNMIPRADKIGADVVVGSRFLPTSQYIGGGRKNLSRIYAGLCNFAFGKYVVSDWTSGYRSFTADALKVLLASPPYWTGGHSWQAEVIHRAARKGLRIAQEPITYKAGRSSMKSSQIWDAFLVLNKVMHL